MDIAQTVIFCTMINLRSSALRVICASFVGAVIGCVLIVSSCHPMLKFIFANIMTPCVMIYILYRGRSRFGVRTVLRYVLVWYICAFTLDGLVDYITKGTLTVGRMVAMAFGICMLCVTVIRRCNVASVRNMNDGLYNITIYKRKRSVSGYARYDSANMLTEPVSGLAVIVCDREAVSSFLTEGEKRYMDMFPALPDEWDGVTYIRSVPYNSIGRKHGILPALLLDEVYISKDNRYMKYGRCYLGVSDECIASDAAYDFLLNHRMTL